MIFIIAICPQYRSPKFQIAIKWKILKMTNKRAFHELYWSVFIVSWKHYILILTKHTRFNIMHNNNETIFVNRTRRGSTKSPYFRVLQLQTNWNMNYHLFKVCYGLGMVTVNIYSKHSASATDQHTSYYYYSEFDITDHYVRLCTLVKYMLCLRYIIKSQESLRVWHSRPQPHGSNIKFPIQHKIKPQGMLSLTYCHSCINGNSFQ